jgi:hypothetical protein
LQAGRPGNTLRTHRPGRTDHSHRTLWPDRSVQTVEAVHTHRPLWPDRSVLTILTVQTCRTLWPDRSVQTVEAGGTLWADGARIPLGADRAGGTDRTHQPLWPDRSVLTILTVKTCRTLWPDRSALTGGAYRTLRTDSALRSRVAWRSSGPFGPDRARRSFGTRRSPITHTRRTDGSLTTASAAHVPLLHVFARAAFVRCAHDPELAGASCHTGDHGARSMAAPSGGDRTDE